MKLKGASYEMNLLLFNKSEEVGLGYLKVYLTQYHDESNTKHFEFHI